MQGIIAEERSIYDYYGVEKRGQSINIWQRNFFNLARIDSGVDFTICDFLTSRSSPFILNSFGYRISQHDRDRTLDRIASIV